MFRNNVANGSKQVMYNIRTSKQNPPRILLIPIISILFYSATGRFTAGKFGKYLLELCIEESLKKELCEAVQVHEQEATNNLVHVLVNYPMHECCTVADKSRHG